MEWIRSSRRVTRAGGSGLPKEEANLQQMIATSRELPVLRRIQIIRSTAEWATVVWFPAMLVALSLGNGRWGGAIGMGGVAFAGILRAAVLWSRCPRCYERYGDLEDGFREIWRRDRCAGCGLSRYLH